MNEVQLAGSLRMSQDGRFFHDQHRDFGEVDGNEETYGRGAARGGDR
jgi:hypothetical protein